MAVVVVVMMMMMMMICPPHVFLAHYTKGQPWRCLQSPGLLGDVNWLGIDTLPQSSRRANGVAERWGIQVLLGPRPDGLINHGRPTSASRCLFSVDDRATFYC